MVMVFRSGPMERDMKVDGWKARQEDSGNTTIQMAICTKDSFLTISSTDKESTSMQTELNTQENG